MNKVQLSRLPAFKCFSLTKATWKGKRIATKNKQFKQMSSADKLSGEPGWFSWLLYSQPCYFLSSPRPMGRWVLQYSCFVYCPCFLKTWWKSKSWGDFSLLVFMDFGLTVFYKSILFPIITATDLLNSISFCFFLLPLLPLSSFLCMRNKVLTLSLSPLHSS